MPARRPIVTPYRQDETYRAGLEGQRPTEDGGGACTLLVLRVGGQVRLLHHATMVACAELSGEQAVELAGYLADAARRQ